MVHVLTNLPEPHRWDLDEIKDYDEMRKTDKKKFKRYHLGPTFHYKTLFSALKMVLKITPFSVSAKPMASAVLQTSITKRLDATDGGQLAAEEGSTKIRKKMKMLK